MSNRAADAENLRVRVRQRPGDRVAWHNLAAAEGDIGRPVEAEVAARRALALGLTAPETYLVLARALQAQRRLDEAERAFEDALRSRPTFAEAHRDYAQLVWMRTGQRNHALTRLDQSLAAYPQDSALHFVRSVILESTGDESGALASAMRAIELSPKDVPLLEHGSQLCCAMRQPERAVELARRAADSGGGTRTRIVLCEALIAANQLDDAAACVGQLRASAPLNQQVIALSATLWRLQGDSRYAELYDYRSLVVEVPLDRPPGYPTLEHFMRDVAQELDGLHQFQSHPFHQSVRAGSQLTFLEDDMTRPLIRTLFSSISNGVNAYLRLLGPGTDPMRARNTGRGNFTGAWSIRLESGGSHIDHVHPHGWLSSACYIAVPSTLGSGTPRDRDQPDHSGWLRFGRPGIRTAQALPAERYIKPAAGRLVLFPAYMWHGVEPFEGAEKRLSVAFDVVPA